MARLLPQIRFGQVLLVAPLHVGLGENGPDDALVGVLMDPIEVVEDLHAAGAHDLLEPGRLRLPLLVRELEALSEPQSAGERVVDADAEPIPRVLQGLADDRVLDGVGAGDHA